MSRLHIVIYSKPGCRLCDEMKHAVQALLRTGFNDSPEALIEEIDITRDPELERRYRFDIPVLWINGREVGKGRMTEEELKRSMTTNQTVAGI